MKEVKIDNLPFDMQDYIKRIEHPVKRQWILEAIHILQDTLGYPESKYQASPERAFIDGYVEHASITALTSIAGGEKWEEKFIDAVKFWNSQKANLVEQVQRHDWKTILDMIALFDERMFSQYIPIDLPEIKHIFTGVLRQNELHKKLSAIGIIFSDRLRVIAAIDEIDHSFFSDTVELKPLESQQKWDIESVMKKLDEKIEHSTRLLEAARNDRDKISIAGYTIQISAYNDCKHLLKHMKIHLTNLPTNQ